MFRSQHFRLLVLCLCTLVLAVSPSALSQDTVGDVPPSEGGGTLLNLIRFSGILPEAAAKTLELRFSLFTDQAGGMALWSETQGVKVASDGRYSVLLGATAPEGLPQSLFQVSAARWIQVDEAYADSASNAVLVSTALNVPGRRALLAVVPYAFKSFDSEALAGRPAGEYVTREDLRNTVSNQVRSEFCVRAPNPAGVAISDPGTAGFLPLWSTASALATSVVAEYGANIGIGTIAPASTLDVNGGSTLRGAVNLPASPASPGSATNSPLLQFEANTYSSQSNAAVPQHFAWQAIASGNNTASPSANLALLFGTGPSTPASTGLTIAPSGLINFAPGQTFPGAAIAATGGVSSVTVGPGLTGGGTGGDITIKLASPVGLENGGTGTTNPADALARLGGMPIAGGWMTGQVSGPSFNNVIQVDGISHPTIASALANCPAAGCVIDARGGLGSHALGAFDPGSRSVTLLLGPFNDYTATQITLRTALQLIGTRYGNSPVSGTPATGSGTSITSVSTSNQPLFVLPQASNTPAQNVHLSGFQVNGAAGNTSQDGFFLDCSKFTNAGLWYSTFHDISIAGFKGVGLHLRSTPNDGSSAIQFNQFDNVQVVQPAGAGEGLRIEGSVGNNQFRAGGINGTAKGNGTGIYIGVNGTGSFVPYSNRFESVTIQLLLNGVVLNGSESNTFQGVHMELNTNAFVLQGNFNFGNVVRDGIFAGNVGDAAGGGMLFSAQSSGSLTSLLVEGNTFGGQSTWYKGLGTTRGIVFRNNANASDSVGGFTTSGVVPQLNPAAELNLWGFHVVDLNGSATPVTTLQSDLTPGEMLTLHALGPITIGPGGNIDLPRGATINLPSSGSITLTRDDLTAKWIVIAVNPAQ